MTTVTVNGVTRDDTCDECQEHQVMHHGSRDLCCRCFVLAGNAPADWHTVCMETYRELKVEERTCT